MQMIVDSMDVGSLSVVARALARECNNPFERVTGRVLRANDDRQLTMAVAAVGALVRVEQRAAAGVAGLNNTIIAATQTAVARFEGGREAGAPGSYSARVTTPGFEAEGLISP